MTPSQDLSKLGKWVIVTGCTGGLGKCFAESLAKRGFKLLLVSRSASKLEALAAELKAAHGESRTMICGSDWLLSSGCDAGS